MFFGKRFSGYHKGSLSGLDILVLSMIRNNKDLTGYDIIQKINRKFRGLWRGSAGTIYPLLSRLAEQGYVDITEITENNRQKKIYEITEKGIEELKKVLSNNLVPNWNTLEEFVRTIAKGMPRAEKILEGMFCCFPFYGHKHEEHIDRSDTSMYNIKRIEGTIKELEHSKKIFEHRLDKINKDIVEYINILKEIKEKRKNAKPIEILDDDEYDNYVI